MPVDALRVAFIAKVRAGAKKAQAALDGAAADLREYALLGYGPTGSNAITTDDCVDTGLTPADVAAVMAVYSQVTSDLQANGAAGATAIVKAAR